MYFSNLKLITKNNCLNNKFARNVRLFCSSYRNDVVTFFTAVNSSNSSLQFSKIGVLAVCCFVLSSSSFLSRWNLEWPFKKVKSCYWIWHCLHHFFWVSDILECPFKKIKTLQNITLSSPYFLSRWNLEWQFKNVKSRHWIMHCLHHLFWVSESLNDPLKK